MRNGQKIYDTEKEVGSTFCIYLPASSKEITEKKVKDDKPPVGNGKILIMDDNDSIRDMGSHTLSFIGYEVECAKEGAEAIEMYIEAKEKNKRNS